MLGPSPHFDSFFDEPRYWLDYDEAVEVLGDAVKYSNQYRIAFRDVAASTNERTLLSSIISPTFHGNTIPSFIIVNDNHKKLEKNLLFWVESIPNSFCSDFIMRQKITNHMNFFYMKTLSVPRIEKNKDSNLLFAFSIISRATRLNCTNELFTNLWQSVFGVLSVKTYLRVNSVFYVIYDS